MGVLSECLLLLLIVQALSIYTAHGEVDKPQPYEGGDEADLALLVSKRGCPLDWIGREPFPYAGFKSCTCEMSSISFDRGNLKCTNKVTIEDEDALIVNKRWLTCYDSNAKLVKNGKKGIIDNKLGRWECKCEDGSWPDVSECKTLTKEKRDLTPEQDDHFLNFIEKRGKNKSKGKGKGGCKKPNAKRGRNVNQLNKDYVEWHNYYRCLHGVGKVTYSSALERVAKQNVQMNVRQGGMEHTSNSNYGENLWAMWGTGFGLGAITGQDPVKAWYDEMTNPGYNFRTPTMFSYGTGHFTQVVWKATKKIGCWTQEHPFQGMTRVFTACEYDPPGNMNVRPRAKNVQNWKQNVPAPK